MWALGLLTAVLNAVVNSGILLGIDGLFDLDMGLKQIAWVSAINGLTGMVNYFRKTPWPWEDDCENE